MLPNVILKDGYLPATVGRLIVTLNGTSLRRPGNTLGTKSMKQYVCYFTCIGSFSVIFRFHKMYALYGNKSHLKWNIHNKTRGNQVKNHLSFFF